jgi:N-methylhydantoinase A
MTAPVIVGVDIGGTFTDVAAVVDGNLRIAKVLSTPHDQSLGVADGIRAASVHGPTLLAHGMTVATNALLERRGARTALVTTEGFRDLIEIGRQARADLYDLTARRGAPLVPRELRFTVRERVGPEGIIVPLDEDSVEQCVAALAAAKVEAVAVCLLFAFRDPAHERALGKAITRALPNVHVSLSSQVLPEFREYERLSTTVADAFLAPEMTRYLSGIVERVAPLGVVETRIMQSSGGVVGIEEAARLPVSCVLSGPAGGVIGAAAIARELGHLNVLTLDVGGTSADVAAIVDGEVGVTSERVVAGVALRLPILDVHTISAGGGSIVWVDGGGGLRIGPKSAGASPGPAAYARGGTAATVTDANVLLGYLRDGAVLGSQVRLSAEHAEHALSVVAEQTELSPIELAAGVTQLTATAVAQALREITIARGLDPREFALVVFGGAGALHACSVADELAIPIVLVPFAGGVLSALGLALSDTRIDSVRSVLADAAALDPAELNKWFEELEHALGVRLRGARFARHADIRYRRQAHELTVEAGAPGDLVARFHAMHRQRHGYALEQEPVQIVNIRTTATLPNPNAKCVPHAHPLSGASEVTRAAWFEGELRETIVISGIPPADVHLEGPAIVELDGSTCVVPPRWRATTADRIALRLERE